MSKLIRKILVRLRLRKQHETVKTTGWKWYGGYGTTISDSEWLLFEERREDV